METGKCCQQAEERELLTSSEVELMETSIPRRVRPRRVLLTSSEVELMETRYCQLGRLPRISLLTSSEVELMETT